MCCGVQTNHLRFACTAGYGQRKILRKGDYYNLARLAGKTHLEYVTPFNATILRDADGGLVDWNQVNFVGEVTVDVQVLSTVTALKISHRRTTVPA